MDYCYCGQWIISIWGSHALSAMAGALLTLLALRLKNSPSEIATEDDRAGESRSGEGEKTNSQEDADFDPHHQPRRTARRRMSTISGSFTGVDGENRKSIASLINDCSDEIDQADEYVRVGNGTSDAVPSETGSFIEDKARRRSKAFNEQVVSKISTLEECKLLLHRTRAVSALASPLMAAPDEESCYEVVTRLLVPLFCIDRCNYALMKDAEHIVVKSVDVKQRSKATKMGLDQEENGSWSWKVPIKDTMVGVCAETLQQQYCPRTREGKFELQRKLHKVGVNTVLATPILVNGVKFAGCIVVCSAKEDAFKEYDKLLIQDLASMLGANIYAKRMRRAAEKSNRIAREMLHSMIPEAVIEKIEVFWDQNSEEYQLRRSLCHTELSVASDEDTTAFDSEANTGDSDVSEKIDFLQQMNTDEGSDAGCIVDTSSMEIGSVARALYAENVKDVIIIFTDIVGFSKLALDMKPLEVMDMLHALFCRFDALCDKHGVKKLETVGDAYICTTNLFDGDRHGGDVKIAALHALNMAKDMILATKEVILPSRIFEEKNSIERKTLSLRVGMHIGEVNCGVLGERLPKFSVFGNTMNIAARMEQASRPNMIRVTDAFHSLVANVEENEWSEQEMITMKNMGDMPTYIIDPLS